jgi:hypothetical protein
MVMFTLALVVILAFASIVIDLGLLRTDTARLQNALDAGALAGAQVLPATGPTQKGTVTTIVTDYVQANYPSYKNFSLVFYCLLPVGTGTSPDTTQIPNDCPNYPTTNAHSFACVGTECEAACDPATEVATTPTATYEGCDMIGVTANDQQPFTFGQFVGVPSGTVNGGGSGGNPVSYAANTPSLSPVDVVMITDRTQSMAGVDTQNAITAANAVRAEYNPAIQWLAWGVLGPSVTPATTYKGYPSTSCYTVPDKTIGTASAPTDLARWIPIGLEGTGTGTVGPQGTSEDYTKSTSVMATQMASTFPCWDTTTNGLGPNPAGTGNYKSNSSTGTDLADPIRMATYELLNYGRTGARKGIILETDGQANAEVGDSKNYCTDAVNAALAAQKAGIEVYTVGFGLDNNNGDNPTCSDNGLTARQTLVAMASPYASDFAKTDANACDTSTDTSVAAPAGETEHFYCVPKTGAPSTLLANVFAAVANSLASGSRLIQLPVPPPVITSISVNTGSKAGGTTVILTGQYFSNVYSVTFGGASATISTTGWTDTTMTVTSPAGSVGTVNITATNPSGPSNGVGFTYTSP